MLIQILLFLFLGILAGTLTGLIPGIHINLIGALLISLTASIYFSPIYGITFITSMAITHTFLDFIPSIFLGCPDTDTELSVLPGHQLLKKKRGYEAIHLSNIGSLIAIIITSIILIPSIFLINKAYPLIEKLIPYILILISLTLIFQEKRKFNALLVFLLTGFLGFSTSSLDLNQSLLPLLTGLFGASNIILSIKNKTIIPKQKITKSKTNLSRPIKAALLSAPLCSFLPSLGSGQAAIIGNTLIKNSKKQFLVLLGIINTLVMTFSFISLYVLGKTRTGSANAIKEIIPNLEISHLILIVFVILISGIISFYLTSFLGQIFALRLEKINYKKLSYITLSVLAIIVLSISGWKGLFVLVLSTLTGIYCIGLKVRRTNMMGCMILPTIVWYLF